MDSSISAHQNQRHFSLPDELVLHLFSFLPAQSIVAASLVSKEWNRLAKDESLWKSLCLSRWRLLRPELFKNWKHMYLRRSKQEGNEMNRLLIFCPWTLELLTCNSDGSDTLMLADSASGDELHRAQATWDPFSNSVIWTEASDEGCCVCEYRFQTGQTTRHRTQFPPFYFYFSPDATRVAYLGNGTVRSTLTLRLLDLECPGDLERDSLIGFGRPYFFCWAPHLNNTLLTHTGGNKVSIVRVGATSQLGSNTNNGNTNASVSSTLQSRGANGSNSQNNLRDETLLHIKSSNAFCSPIWSSSGNLIIYAVEQEDSRTIIFICRNDGSVIRKVENIPGHTRLSLSRDERYLAHTRETQAGINTPLTLGALHIYDMQTSQCIEISREPVIAFFFSPNSRYLLWMHYVMPNCVIWAVRDLHQHKTIRFSHEFIPTNILLREYLFFFDQYAHSMTLFSPDSSAFVYAAMPLGIFVQRIEEGAKAKKVHAQGGFACWSPT